MQKPLEAGEGALPGLGQVAGNEEVGPVVGKARREALRPGLGRKAEGALEEGEPFIAKVYYQGTQLTGDALKGVELEGGRDTSNDEIKKEFSRKEAYF